ncbi:MAG: flagellar basal body P-ring formation protein FlgA [Balneolaceae bacterium]|nr:flagellar basal body P-ring formation protein FlgA [Balneolaceae bacterium]
MIFNALIALVFMFVPTSTGNTAGDDATKERILELAEATISKHLDEEVVRFDVKARWIPGSVLASEPNDVLSVSLNGSIQKYTRFTVNYSTRAGTQSADIQLLVETQQLIPVALRRIKSGENVSTADFELQWTPVELGKDRFVENLDELNGKSIRRTLLAGRPVRAHEVSSPVLVKAGEPVYMHYSDGTIALTLQCESRNNGSAGEEIQIYCQETRKKYTTKIIAAGEVKWLRTN